MFFFVWDLHVPICRAPDLFPAIPLTLVPRLKGVADVAGNDHVGRQTGRNGLHHHDEGDQ